MSTETDRKPKRGRIAVGVFAGLVVIGLVIAGFALWGNLWEAEQRKTESEVYDQAITRLDIEGDSGDIEIVVSDGDEVRVERTLRWSGDRVPKSVETWNSEILRIRIEGCQGFSIGFSRCAVDYRIEVPAHVEVIAYADSGALTTTGIDGAQKLRADSGDIDVTDAGSDVDASVDSGSVTIDGVAGDVTTDVDSGNTTIVDMSGTSFTGKADSGDIEVTFSTAPETVDVIADSGNVTVVVPAGDDTYDVNSTVDSGSSDVGVVDDPDSPRKVTASVDSGDFAIRAA